MPLPLPMGGFNLWRLCCLQARRGAGGYTATFTDHHSVTIPQNDPDVTTAVHHSPLATDSLLNITAGRFRKFVSTNGESRAVSRPPLASAANKLLPLLYSGQRVSALRTYAL
jgi:hypothetical protein